MEKLILREKRDDYFLTYIEDNRLNSIYKKNINYNNIFFKISYRYSLPTLKIFLDKNYKRVKDVKQIIIFDNCYNKRIAKIIKKINSRVNIVLYYWNKINESNIKLLEDKNIDQFYTFNIEDSKKYKLKLNPQFYTKNIKLNDYSNKEIDVLFLGMAKQRRKYIEDLEIQFNENNIKTEINIIENTKDFASYDKYLKKLENTKAILDIGNTEDSGLTLRAMEALFFNKKLITNYKNIKEYEFYNSNNIFILGKDNLGGIKKFINSPYEQVEKSIVDYYDFQEWIKRFEV